MAVKTEAKPLFIPLKTEFYEAFERGDKTNEFRIYGARWNESTCKLGRKVVISKGYGKAHRIYGVIDGFRKSDVQNLRQDIRESLDQIYGDKVIAGIAVISIDTKPDFQYLNDAEQNAIQAYFFEGARRVEEKPEHWVYGPLADASFSYCRDCCVKEVAHLNTQEVGHGVDGGWGCESDSTPYCETCQCLLGASLTSYGCEEEIRHFEYHGFDIECDGDRRAMFEVISSAGFSHLKYAWNRRLHRLCRSILKRLN